MVNGIRTISFCLASWVRHNTPEEDRRVSRPERYVYSNGDKEHIPNILSDKMPKDASAKIVRKRFAQSAGAVEYTYCITAES